MLPILVVCQGKKHGSTYRGKENPVTDFSITGTVPALEGTRRAPGCFRILQTGTKIVGVCSFPLRFEQKHYSTPVKWLGVDRRINTR